MCLIFFLASVILLTHGGECELTWDKVYGLLSAKLDKIILEQDVMKQEMRDLMTSMTATNQQVISLEKRLTGVATISQQMVVFQERLDNMDSHVKYVAAAEVGRRTHLWRRGLEQEKAAAQLRSEKTQVQIITLSQEFEGSKNNTRDLPARVDSLDNKQDIIKSEMQQISEKTQAQIANVEQDVVTTQRNTQTLQSRVDTIDRLQSDLKSKTSNIERKVDTTRQQISRLQDDTGEFVGFSYRLYGSYYNKIIVQANIYQNTVIKFRLLSYHEGASLNTETGLFTVPVSGVYIFSFDVLLEISYKKEADLVLYVNEYIKAEARATDRNKFARACATTVLTVYAKDRVYVSTHNAYYSFIIFPEGYFSGILLRRI